MFCGLFWGVVFVVVCLFVSIYSLLTKSPIEKPFWHVIIRKKKKVAELTFVFLRNWREKHSPVHSQKNREYMCFRIFIFGKGVQGEVSLEGEYI